MSIVTLRSLPTTPTTLSPSDGSSCRGLIDKRMLGTTDNGKLKDEKHALHNNQKMGEDVEDAARQPESDKSNDRQTSPWRSLFNFTDRQHLFVLVLALVLSIASGIVIPALAIFLGKIFNLFSHFGAGNLTGRDLVHKVTIDCFGLVGLGSASWILNGGYFMAWLVFGELQAKSVRDKLYANLLEKDLEWFEIRRDGVGALLPRLQTQIRELQTATSQPLGFAVQYSVTTIAALGLAFYYSWKLTLVTLAAVPVSGFILSFLAKQMQPSIEAQQAELSKAAKLTNSAISSIETVKCYNGQHFETSQYSQAIQKAAKFYLKQARSSSLQIGFVRVVTLSMFVQGFWYGSSLVGSGKVSAGDVLTTFWGCLMATRSVEQILPQMIILEKGRAAGASLMAILQQVNKGKNVAKMIGRKTPQFCDGDIEVRDVTFAYPSRPDKLVLQKSTFFFPSGETTFVVGRSGSGKSTLGNLLMRFYDATSGDIYLDGNPIRTLDMNWLRNNTSLVQQQSILFNETIFRNISFGWRDYSRVTKEHVKQCLDLAMLENTILEMPQGLDTVVGAGGSALSGGQKQRIAIARGRLRDTPVLVLDESTSALDYISRTLVLDAIRKWRHGKTTIIITHDMSQIQEQDFAYVLEHGRIVQEGYRGAIALGEKSIFPVSLTPDIPPAAHLMDEFGPISPPYESTRRTNDLSRSVSTSSRPPPPPPKGDLDIRVQSQNTFVPTVFDIPENDTRNRMPSYAFISPISPSVDPFPVRRVPSIKARLPNQTVQVQRQRPLSAIFSKNLAPPNMEMANMGGSARLSRVMEVNRTNAHNNTRRTSDSKPDTYERNAPPVSLLPRRRKRKLGQREKEQGTLPVQQILLTVWPTLRWKHRVCLGMGFVTAFAHAGAVPLFAWVFSQLLSTLYLKTGRAQASLKWSMAILGIAVGDAIASYLMHYLLEIAGQAWVDRLRVEALRRVLDQPKAWFEKDENNLARLTACLDRNAEEMRNLVGRFAGFVFVAVSMMGIAVIWSMVVCWKLTLVGLACGPVLYGITRGFESVSGKWEGRSNDAGEAAGSIFAETFTDIRTVRALTLESYFHKKYRKATSRAMSIGLKRCAYSGVFFGLSDSAIIFVNAMIFWYGATVASSHDFTVKNILTVFSMLLFSIANANAVIAFIPQISSSCDTSTRLLRLANSPYGTSHEHTGTLRIQNTGSIKFMNLNFAYPSRPDTLVLKNFNLTIPMNMCTAIVGQSGSGKSTVASLLLGFYPPGNSNTDRPTITIDGRDIRQLHLPTLRSLMAVVPQNPTLFAATVRENLSYGLEPSSPLSSMTNIRTAADSAGIDDFIKTLPQGYNTMIGDGGMGLSGGQAQRLVIARALVRRPKILILDEATSALDAESAEVVKQSVRLLVEKGQGMTVIIITHAVEMIQFAENVVVLEQGRVVEEGSYQALRDRPGQLRRMLTAGGVLE